MPCCLPYCHTTQIPNANEAMLHWAAHTPTTANTFTHSHSSRWVKVGKFGAATPQIPISIGTSEVPPYLPRSTSGLLRG